MPVPTTRQSGNPGGRELDDPFATTVVTRSNRGRRAQAAAAGASATATGESEFLTSTTGGQPTRQNDAIQSILFNQSKDEPYTLSSGYKKFQHELKSWKIGVNREDITLERLLQAKLFVTASPFKKFSASEIDALKRYVSPPHSGSILILLTEGGESKLNTNINVFLDEFGIKVCNFKCYFMNFILENLNFLIKRLIMMLSSELLTLNITIQKKPSCLMVF